MTSDYVVRLILWWRTDKAVIGFHRDTFAKIAVLFPRRSVKALQPHAFTFSLLISSNDFENLVPAGIASRSER